MGKGEWFSIAGITLALITGGFAAWVQNESRISAVENALKDQKRSDDILVSEVLELTKLVAQLQGLHDSHKVIREHIGQDLERGK